MANSVVPYTSQPVYPLTYQAPSSQRLMQVGQLKAVAFSGKDTDKATDASTKTPSFLNITFKEGIKGAATVGVTLALAPLLGPAMAGVVGGGKVLSTVVFGLLIPAATEYGLLKFEGNMSQYKGWLGQKVYQPAEKMVNSFANSFIGKKIIKNPKAWSTEILDKLKPDNLTKTLESTSAASNKASPAKTVTSTADKPFKQVLNKFKQFKSKNGFGKALLISLHQGMAGLRKQFGVGQITKGKFGCSPAGCGTLLRGLFKPRSLRLGLLFKQIVIANTVMWVGMKAISLATKALYGKTVQQLVSDEDDTPPNADTAVDESNEPSTDTNPDSMLDKHA